MVPVHLLSSPLLISVLDRVKQLESPATLDGGDVLWTGKRILLLLLLVLNTLSPIPIRSPFLILFLDLFVGLSNRTNAESIRQLRAIVPSSVPVYELPVAAGLHLKSICSHVTSNIIVMHGSEQGRYGPPLSPHSSYHVP